MTNSRDWENGGLKLDRRGVERDSPLQQESNVMTKKFAIAVVALLAGALMLPNHEALARGEGGHGGDFGGGGFHGGALGGGSHGGGFGGRGFSHFVVRRGFDQPWPAASKDRHASAHMSSQKWGGPTAYPGLDNLDWDDE
jgi:hypothetical protein